MYLFLDGKQCLDKSQLFEQCKTTLNFPDYFSENWDSFEEILTDIQDFNQELQAIILLNYDDFLKNTISEKITFEEILKSHNRENMCKIFKPIIIA